MAALLVAGVLAVAGALITASHVSSVKSIWDEYEAERSEKAGALGALRKEIGYGGMIHEFKNFVLRHDEHRFDLVSRKLGGATSAIASYRALGLNAEEEAALKDVEQMLDSYGIALSTAATLVGEGRKPHEIDRVVRVDDGPAINGLDTLDREVTRSYAGGARVQSKSQAVAALRKAMGYNGLIHNFKNLVLRQSPSLKNNVQLDFIAVRLALDQYRQRDLTQTESEAIRNIESTVDQYEAALKEIDGRFGIGERPVQIDQGVRVDDRRAFSAFDDLTREIAMESARDSRRVDQELTFVLALAKATAWTILVVTLILIAASVRIFRYQIIRPISRMTRLMTKLAKGDMTLHVHAAEQTNEIGEMARAIEIFKDNAIERVRVEKVKAEFLASMSHELRTPMNAVLGFSQLLDADTEEPLTDQQRIFVDEILSSGRHMVELIDRVLDLQSIEQEIEALNLMSSDAGAIIEECLRVIDAEATASGITVVNQIPGGGLPPIMIDPLRFRQAVLNLISNAIKYNSENGTVTVDCRQRGESALRISVTDTGAGISGDNKHKVFEPFERLGVENSNILGAGVGLSVTKQFVESMGGAIGFESTPGSGTTFWIDLPLAEPETAHRDLKSRSAV